MQPEFLAAGLPSPLKEHFLSGRFRDFEHLTRDSRDYQVQLCRDYIHQVLAGLFTRDGVECCARLSLRHLEQLLPSHNPPQDPESQIFYNLRHLGRKLTLPIEAQELPIREAPYPGPYLSAPADQIRAWSERLQRWPGKKVGLIWGPGLALQAYADLPAGPHYFGLQTGPHQIQALWPPAGMAFTDLSEYLEDWPCVAGLLQNLDLLISVDHPTAHLAGAMGRPLRVVSNIGDYGPKTKKLWTARSSKARKRNRPLEHRQHDAHAPPKPPTRSRATQ